MRKCTKCNTDKTSDELSDNNHWCKDCQNQRARERRAGVHATAPTNAYDKFIQTPFESTNMLSSINGRAKRNNIPFNLTIEDCLIPTHCPILGIPLSVGNHSNKFNSPAIDRLVPTDGYIKGNVNVISHRANTIKHDYGIIKLQTERELALARAADLDKIVKWLQQRST